MTEFYYDDESPIRVLLPAYLIPLGAKVTKRTGEKEYTLKNEIKIYGEGGQEIKAPKETLFLVCEGSTNIIERDTVLLWGATDYDLSEFLQGRDQGAPTQ